MPRWASLCLEILQAAGAGLRPDGAGSAAWHVELPEEVACRRWGTPYRPHPPLLLRFGADAPPCAPDDAARRDIGKGPETPSPAGPSAEAEPVSPWSRRLLDVVDLALDGGWLGVGHEQDGQRPALWVLVEAVGDSVGSGTGMAARCFAAWVDLGSPPLRAPAALPYPAPPPVLVLKAGRPPGSPDRRHQKLGRALRHAAGAVARLACGGSGAAPWLRGRNPRLQLFLIMAALVYLRPERSWPPPARLSLGSSAAAGGSTAVPDPVAKAGQVGAAT